MKPGSWPGAASVLLSAWAIKWLAITPPASKTSLICGCSIKLRKTFKFWLPDSGLTVATISRTGSIFQHLHRPGFRTRKRKTLTGMLGGMATNSLSAAWVPVSPEPVRPGRQSIATPARSAIDRHECLHCWPAGVIDVEAGLVVFR